MVGLFSGIRERFRRTRERFNRPYNTRKAVEDTVQSMIDGDCLVYIAPWGDYRHIGVEVDDQDVSDYLKNNKMGAPFSNFNEVLAQEIDRRMRIEGTDIRSDGIIDRTYKIRVYPGGHRRENPHL